MKELRLESITQNKTAMNILQEVPRLKTLAYKLRAENKKLKTRVRDLEIQNVRLVKEAFRLQAEGTIRSFVQNTFPDTATHKQQKGFQKPTLY